MKGKKPENNEQEKQEAEDKPEEKPKNEDGKIKYSIFRSLIILIELNRWWSIHQVYGWAAKDQNRTRKRESKQRIVYAQGNPRFWCQRYKRYKLKLNHEHIPNNSNNFPSLDSEPIKFTYD